MPVEGMRSRTSENDMEKIYSKFRPILTIGFAVLLCARASAASAGLRFEYASYSVPEEDAFVQIAVIRSGDTNAAVTVDYATQSGSALPNVNYSEAAGHLAFEPGETWKTFNVPVLNNSKKEAAKTFFAILTNATGGVILQTLKKATISIRDNDSGVQFEFKQCWASENDAEVTIKVLRGSDIDLSAFTVDFITSDLTAIAGKNYPKSNGTLQFTNAESVRNIVIPILRDGFVSAEKKFKVTLTNASPGINLGTTTVATIAILDSDGLQVHAMGGITAQGDKPVLLELTGANTAPQFKPFLDWYPIEVSSDLVRWPLIGSAFRDNASLTAASYTDTNSDGLARFYRTSAASLVSIFPPPSGPYAVGRRHRLLSDSSRHNRYGISTNSSFWATIWYPAEVKSPTVPELLFTSNLVTAFVQDGFDPREAWLRGEVPQDSSLASNPAAFPVILYSCGGTAIRNDNAILAIELASHGYVVVSADHEDLDYAELPDRRIVPGTLPADSEPTYQSRFQDMQIVLSELESMNSMDSDFHGRLDLKRIGVCGFSTGGVCAAQLCLEESRVQVGVLLDPGLISFVPNLLAKGIAKPFLVITGELSDGRQLFDRAKGDAYWLNIVGTVHLNMGMERLVDEGGAKNRRLAHVVHTYALSMFDRYLQGKDNELLHNPSALYPEVKSILRKP
jgi:hypothetical protein